MTDRNHSILSQGYTAFNNTTKISTSPKKKGLKKSFLDIAALIRSVQRTENKIDCFQRGYDDCDTYDCAWRKYCLINHQAGQHAMEGEISPLIQKKTRGSGIMRMQIKNIMCSTDLSDLSNQALPYGIALAKEFGARLYVCHVIDLPPVAGNSEIHLYPIEAQNKSLSFAYDKLQQLMAKQQVDWEPLIIIGHTADEICRMAEVKQVDLAISATHGRSGLKRMILGSVTERLMRVLPCPLLVVRDSAINLNASGDQGFRFQRILVGCDFSSDSTLAFQYGLSLAQEFESEIHLAHVIELPIYKELRKPAKEGEEKNLQDLRDGINEKLANMVPKETYNWCTLKTILLDGQPYKELTKYAELHDIDLIILGVRGLSLVDTLYLGSTTDRVARGASCPVLSVRPTIRAG